MSAKPFDSEILPSSVRSAHPSAKTPTRFRVESLIKVLILAIALGILGDMVYVWITTDDSLLSHLGQISWGYLLLAIVMATIPHATNSLRIKLWSRVFHRTLTTHRALKAAIFDSLGAAVTPTAIGGGYAKLLYLVRSGLTPGQATLTMVLGSVEDSIFLAVALPVTILASSSWNNPHIAAAGENVAAKLPLILGLIIVLALAYFIYTRVRGNSPRTSPETATKPCTTWTGRIVARIRSFKRDFLTAIRFALRNGRWTMAACLSLSAAGWICRYASINALILAFGLPIDPLLFPLLHWAIFTTTNFIITPGGMGGAELVFASIFGGLVPVALLPTLVLTWRLVTFYLVQLVGAGYLVAEEIGLVRPRQPAATANVAKTSVEQIKSMAS